MKILIVLSAVLLMAAACDVQSDIAKKSVEEYVQTPTPNLSPTPTPEPIDPADILNAETGVLGPMISVNGPKETKTVTCDKYNQVMVNSEENTVTVKGGCRQIMINGDRNEVTIEAASEIVFNGGDNKVRYSRYLNGKHPFIKDKRTGNLAEKISAAEKPAAR